MPRRRRKRSPFYTPRRVPESIAPTYARLKLSPLLPELVVVGAATLIAESPLLPEGLRTATRESAARLGDKVAAKAQETFFDSPGLDTLFIQGISRAANVVSQMGRIWLKVSVAVGADRDGRAATMLPLIPRKGYVSLMTWMLCAGTAVGIIRGGSVHARLVYCASSSDQETQRVLDKPKKHSVEETAAKSNQPSTHDFPTPRIHRYEAPESLHDMALDIDDMYWAGGYGQLIKITRCGEGKDRRWLLSLPGTDHIDLESSPNPADMESNIREILGLPSAMRLGMLQALHDAMARDGIAAEDMAQEKLMICGHSQGGMVAVALASMHPDEAGADIVGILTLGAPARRTRVRPDVAFLAVEHDQDVIPSMDAMTSRAPDQRVVVSRTLVKPRRDPLYYAHSSTTYAQTVKLLERKVEVAPWGRVAAMARTLHSYLPQSGEETRVFFYDIWQELLDPTGADTWDTFIHLDHSQLSNSGAEPENDSASPIKGDLHE